MPASLILSFEERKPMKFTPISIFMNLFVDFRSWMNSFLTKSSKYKHIHKVSGKNILENVYRKGTWFPFPSVACLVSCWISILGCVWRFQSAHTQNVSFRALPGESKRLLPSFSLCGSLGTLALWLIARGKTAYNNWQEEVPMGSQVQLTCV